MYDYNDASGKLHRDMICDFKDMVSFFIKEPKNEFTLYYINESQQEITAIKNRILAL